MVVRRMVLADEDTTKKRVDQLNEQIKQAQETLKQAKESDPKSERVFNLETRVNNLKTQRDRLKHRADEQKENEEKDKEESAFLTKRDAYAALARSKIKRVGGLEARVEVTEACRFTVGIYEVATGKYRRGVRCTFATAQEAADEGAHMLAMATKAPCERHNKPECQSTLCPESPNFNVLTTI